MFDMKADLRPLFNWNTKVLIQHAHLPLLRYLRHWALEQPAMELIFGRDASVNLVKVQSRGRGASSVSCLGGGGAAARVWLLGDRVGPYGWVPAVAFSCALS